MKVLSWVLIVVVIYIIQNWFESMAYQKPKPTTTYKITSGFITGVIANYLIELL